MKDIEREQELIRQYLLGGLDEQRQEQLEQRVITSSDYKQEVLITEEEVLEDFVNGTLSPHERELFLKRYSSSPILVRKVAVAKALAAYAADHPIPLPQVASEPELEATPRKSNWARSILEFFRPQPRSRRFALATLMVLFVAGALLLYWLITKDQRANYQALTELNGLQSKILAPDDSLASASLSPLLRGTGEAKNITVSRATKVVQLLLADPSNGTRPYFVVLKDSAAGEVFKLPELRPRPMGQGSVLALQIPAQMLSPQDYELEISELNSDGIPHNSVIYRFRVQASE